jgi:hypothetical protein
MTDCLALPWFAPPLASRRALRQIDAVPHETGALGQGRARTSPLGRLEGNLVELQARRAAGDPDSTASIDAFGSRRIATAARTLQAGNERDKLSSDSLVDGGARPLHRREAVNPPCWRRGRQRVAVRTAVLRAEMASRNLRGPRGVILAGSLRRPAADWAHRTFRFALRP